MFFSYFKFYYKSSTFPISVFCPVPTTIPTQRPDATLVPEKSMLVLSWLTARLSSIASVVFWTETDSPVRRACSSFKICENLNKWLSLIWQNFNITFFVKNYPDQFALRWSWSGELGYRRGPGLRRRPQRYLRGRFRGQEHAEPEKCLLKILFAYFFDLMR